MNLTIKEIIKQELSQKDFLSTQEIYSHFPNTNIQTVSWHLHQMLIREEIVQIRHGCYRLNTKTKTDIVPKESLEIINVLKDIGYDFYLSGLDSLLQSNIKIEGTFPSIICTTANRVKDLQLQLMRTSDFALTENDNINIINKQVRYYILKTSAFELSNSNIALPEKAFVDLYFAITRLNYPVSITHLPKILSMIKPNEYKFRTATHDRGLSDELNFLLSYNKSFVKAFCALLGD